MTDIIEFKRMNKLYEYEFNCVLNAYIDFSELHIYFLSFAFMESNFGSSKII